ncbi:hypothetical protein L873DRAFT_1809760 [Choiromyces venosus 120613-1]|uniref:Uncharacterized protein n=1 Tax=Choiromyces venosus 120613-1 TaxID=1336337 RepID=A0A3N4JM36_9PEZI|nr:hypothetical protein L873DRAFT_1809760 [Choiromyces venosus 120613-1]
MRPFLRTSRLLLRPLSSRPPIRPLLPHPQNLHTTPSHLHPQTTSLERGTSNTPLEGHNSDTPSASPGLSGLDIYSDLPSPINSIEALYNTHFLLTNGTATAPGSGVFLLNDSAFAWTPDVSVDAGRVEFGKGAWGVLEIVWPKPGILLSFLFFSFLSFLDAPGGGGTGMEAEFFFFLGDW